MLPPCSMVNIMLPVTASAWRQQWCVSDGLGRHILGGQLSPQQSQRQPGLLWGARIKSSEWLSDLTLVQWALGFSWCMTMFGLMWPESVGSTWMLKALCITVVRDTIYCCIHHHQVPPQTVQSLMPWSRSGRRSPRTPATKAGLYCIVHGKGGMIV